MILQCDFCKAKWTIAEADADCVTGGDPCPHCEEKNEDGVLECRYEDDSDERTS